MGTRSMKNLKTSECDKMLAVREKSHLIGEFLEWLGQQGIELAKMHKHSEGCLDEDGRWDVCGYRSGGLEPTSLSIEALLADYFEIDLVKVEREKRAILKEIRRES